MNLHEFAKLLHNVSLNIFANSINPRTKLKGCRIHWVKNDTISDLSNYATNSGE